MPENLISIEYLIELISDIKSALSTIDNTNQRHHEILSEISENITILSELNKKQNQDQKLLYFKYDEIVRGLSDLISEVRLSNQQIVSSNEKLQSNLEITDKYERDNINEIQKCIGSLSRDLQYLRQEEEKTSLAKTIQDAKHESNFKLLGKASDFIKNLGASAGSFYKVLLLIVIIALIVLWLTGVITWEDIKNIVGSFNVF